MQILLEYPKRQYVRRFISAIKQEQSIQVTVLNPKLVNLIRKTLVEFGETATSVEFDETATSKDNCFSFFTRWFRLANFLTAHFYAEAAGYRFSLNGENSLVILYTKST